MAIKNSDVRAYVVSSTLPASHKGSSGLIVVALFAMFGFVGAYAYKIGFFSRSRPVTVAAAPAAKPVEAPPQVTQQNIEPPPLRAAAVVSTRVDPRDANDALEKVLAVSLKNGLNTLRGMEYMASFEGVLKGGSPPAPGRAQAPPRALDPKDVVGNCARELELRMGRQPATLQQKSNALMFSILTELAVCSVRRAESMICEKKPREQVIAQIKFYDGLRADALKVASSDPDLSRLVMAAFSMGVHDELGRALRQVGSKGGLKSADFSLFPSKFIADAFDPSKTVPPRCAKA